ncbi:hypothetical protein Nepgr_026426 [Nepenthes gracilis]|uniref:Uncharacterized protein n=1 Tax=Nepenthes gracilis TaxID=150966 RepID=A0AAD3Y0J6_NEPGR|nr:hypothetical protein Nepgr_026426 [Nepenthes gracilis]
MVMRNLGMKMPDNRHFTRINVAEIKTRIGKKLGAQKAKKYYDLLTGLFDRKLTKSEFDRLCVSAIGRENIRLHNLLISSILKNACLSKTPPPKGRKLECLPNGKVVNGYQISCLQSLSRDTFPQSPRRGRTPSNRDRRFRDRPSPLGPHGKPQNAALASEDLAPKIQEQQPATEVLLSLGSRPFEINSVEDGEEVDQAARSPGIHGRGPVMAPIGIPMTVKAPRKVSRAVSTAAMNMETCEGSGELPDTCSLRKWLEQKLDHQGLKMSLDFVNLLNSGIDVFLKRLIKPSLDLAASRLGNGQQDHRSNQSILASISDFRMAMEMNPTVLGEDWPIQLEKICLRESEEF